jgi:glycosyltransferase involved in cell wall biosynthesis
MRLAVIASHLVQYYAPLYRELARRMDLTVFYAHRATPADQSKAGFGVAFDWDVDLTSGYEHCFLKNVSRQPGTNHFTGCDCPEIRARLREGKFDAVLLQGWYLKIFVQALFAAKRQGLPILVRGDSQLETPRPGLKKVVKAIAYPPALRLFDAALYVGARSKAYWEHYGYPVSRLFHSPHCVDNDWFAARATPEARAQLRDRIGITPEARVVLFAGKLVPFKRPLDLLEAVGNLKREERSVTVLVAGAGPLEQEMINRSQERGIELRMLGFCNQTAMPAAYAAADVLVLPSDGRETWGMVANEAIACGTPVVLSSEVGSAGDLGVEPSVVRTYPMGDTNALAAAVCAVLANSTEKAAFRRLREKFSVEAAVAGISAAVGAASA